MSKNDNVALVQKLLDAFGRGDVQGILDNCSKECEFYCPGPDVIPYAGRKKGLAQIKSYFDTLIGTQSDANLSVDQFVADDDNVVAIGRYLAKVNSTGKQFETPVVLTFQVEGGKVSRHMVLGDTAAVSASYSRTSTAAGSK